MYKNQLNNKIELCGIVHFNNRNNNDDGRLGRDQEVGS